MKSRDALLVSTLRMVISALKNEKIALSHELTEEEIIRVLRREVKQRKESAEDFEKAGRKDLAEKELKEAAYIQSYLPELITGEALREKVFSLLEEIQPKGLGEAMKAVMGKFKGRVDGKEVRKVVESWLQR